MTAIPLLKDPDSCLHEFPRRWKNAMKNWISPAESALSRFTSRRTARLSLIVFAACFSVLLLVFATTKFNLRGSYEGLYLLKNPKGALFELTDDIFLGEYERVLFKVEFGRVFSQNTQTVSRDGSLMRYKWHEDGDGYIMNVFPDGSKFLMSFGRFVDSNGLSPNGLFLGGGLPYSAYENEIVTMNETGMAFFNGKRWQHLWCNANESIAPSLSTATPVYPSHWIFLGSKVLYAHGDELVLKSSHAVDLSGRPLLIDRYVLYRAGDLFLTLVIKITNVGNQQTAYDYIYGDEPWVGSFGSSIGNVGWTKDRIYNYEAAVDVNNNSYAGMVDRGNSVLASEKDEVFSGAGNFIQWLGEVRPSLVYFSNQPGRFAEKGEKVPLGSPDNRVLFLQWGPRFLQPGQSEAIILAIGKSETDPKTGFPVKPNLRIDRDYVDYILSHAVTGQE